MTQKNTRPLGQTRGGLRRKDQKTAFLSYPSYMTAVNTARACREARTSAWAKWWMLLHLNSPIGGSLAKNFILRRGTMGHPDLDFNTADDGNFDLLPEGVYRLRARVKRDSEYSALKTTRSRRLQYLELELMIESPMEFRGRKLWDRINCHYIGPEASNLPDDQDEIERFRTSVRIGRSKLKGILESAHNIDPHDDSAEAQAKRRIANFLDFDLLSFVGKVVIEKGTNGYRDKNVLRYPVKNNMVEWPKDAPQRRPMSPKQEFEDKAPF
jgi:hypothetical protein